MSFEKSKSILRFVYSHPYERALLGLAGEKLTKKHSIICREKVEIAQQIWNRHEKQSLALFSEMYKIEIREKWIKVYISLVLPHSYSEPMTISLKTRADLDTNPKSERSFIYVTIHELAHYFAYTRKDKFFNKLYDKIQALDPLKDHGANLHYLIQAVELGIIAEVFGSDYAEYSLRWRIENRRGSEYGKSAKLLQKHKVPLNKTSLDYIDKNIL